MKLNAIQYVVAMATLLAPVPFCEKQNIPIATSLSGTEGLARNKHGSLS